MADGAFRVQQFGFEPRVVRSKTGGPDHGVDSGEVHGRGRRRYDRWRRAIGARQLGVEAVVGRKLVGQGQEALEFQIGRSALVGKRARELRRRTGDAGEPTDELDADCRQRIEVEGSTFRRSYQLQRR